MISAATTCCDTAMRKLEAQMPKSLEQQIPSGKPRIADLGKKAILQSVPMLVLLGLLAGAVGGLGIGLIQSRAPSATSKSAK